MSVLSPSRIEEIRGILSGLQGEADHDIEDYRTIYLALKDLLDERDLMRAVIQGALTSRPCSFYQESVD